MPRSDLTSRKTPPILYGVLLGVWLILLLALYVQGNDFPILWHWDAPSKVGQILSGDWNFRHPVLLLEATQAVAFIAHRHPTPQQIADAGAWVSAVAAVGAVGCLTLTAFYLQGVLAALLTALLVGTTPLLFGLAHYLKEDALHAFAFSTFLLTLVHYGARPSRLGFALMALAVGLAMSSKYIGAVLLPIPIGLILWEHRRHWRAAVEPSLLAVGLASAVFLAVDAPIFGSLPQFLHGLMWETAHAAKDTGGLMRPVWSPFYVEGLFRICTPLLIGGYAWWLAVMLKNGKSTPVQIVVALLPLAYLAMLQLSPLKMIRYELPVAMTVMMLAACGFARLLDVGTMPPVRALAGFGIVAVLGYNIWGLAQSWDAITHDTRAEMATWIRANLPPGTVILEDRIAGLVGQSPDISPGAATVPARVVVNLYAAQIGSLEDTRWTDVRYILIADLCFGHFFNPSLYPNLATPKDVAEVERYRAFYRELFENATLVHKVDSKNPIGTWFSPGLWLFSVAPPVRSDGAPAPKSEMPVFNPLED